MKIMDSCRARRLVLAAILSIGLGFGTHASAVDHSYLIDLKTGTAAFLGNVTASAIDDAGQVVGTNSNHQAFLTGPNGVGMTDLDTLSGGWSDAQSINAAGQVVGFSQTFTNQFGPFHAFITGPNGVGMTDLSMPGWDSSQAYAINASGQVAVRVGTSNGDHAFITGSNGYGYDRSGYSGSINQGQWHQHFRTGCGKLLCL